MLRSSFKDNFSNYTIPANNKSSQIKTHCTSNNKLFLFYYFMIINTPHFFSSRVEFLSGSSYCNKKLDRIYFLAAHLMYNKHPKSNILPSPPQLPKGIIRLWFTPVLNNNKKEHNAVATQETFNLFWWKNIAAISRILRGMLKKMM